MYGELSLVLVTRAERPPNIVFQFGFVTGPAVEALAVANQVFVTLEEKTA